ncbi:MAG TPA: winged helix-turn-helix domain-containing protein, partial [Candidatus Binatus sp.]|nr:winged helix-turn-helix domain-containing protein [Candidatus Binatus sp.]
LLRSKPSGEAFTESRSLPRMSIIDLEIVTVLLDQPTLSINRLVQETGLSRKTIRKHLQSLRQEEMIYILPRVGSLADPGELVYHLAVTGNIGINALRQVLGNDTYQVGGADKPPMKYLLCRGNDLADVTSRTRRALKLPGVESVRVTLNRELMANNQFVHSLIREEMNSLER